MQKNNAFFKHTDNHVTEMDGCVFPAGWWSRGYEYPWALQYAEPGQIVADMGTCFQYRPLRYELAKVCAHVYAVDWNPELLNQKAAPNLEYVVASFMRPVDAIPAGSLDRIFCISVLEELHDIALPALVEFERLLKPDGLAVITMDARYSDERPFPVKYPGVDMESFARKVTQAGLEFVGPLDLDRTDALCHDEWNLTTFHAVLRKARIDEWETYYQDHAQAQSVQNGRIAGDFITALDNAPVTRKAITENKAIIEAGCGTGELCATIAEITNGKVTGIDVSPSAINRAVEQFGDKCEFAAKSFWDESMTGQFDLLIASNILEHFSAWQAALTRWLAIAPRVLILVPYCETWPMGHNWTDGGKEHVTVFDENSFADFKLVDWFTFHTAGWLVGSNPRQMAALIEARRE